MNHVIVESPPVAHCGACGHRAERHVGLLCTQDPSCACRGFLHRGVRYDLQRSSVIDENTSPEELLLDLKTLRYGPPWPGGEELAETASVMMEQAWAAWQEVTEAMMRVPLEEKKSLSRTGLRELQRGLGRLPARPGRPKTSRLPPLDHPVCEPLYRKEF